MAAREVLHAIATTVVKTMESREWMAAALDEDKRAELLLFNLCEALHPFGAVTIPSRHQALDLAERLRRDEDIWLQFDGRNYDELAERYGLAPRHLRRIVERFRRGSR